VIIAVAPGLLSGFGRASLTQCGFTTRDFRRQVQEGFAGFLASIAPVLLLLVATHWWRTEETLHPFLRLLTETPTVETIIWVVLSAVLVAPVQEELLFRVMLQDGLARRIGGQAAILIIAI